LRLKFAIPKKISEEKSSLLEINEEFLNYKEMIISKINIDLSPQTKVKIKGKLITKQTLMTKMQKTFFILLVQDTTGIIKTKFFGSQTTNLEIIQNLKEDE
jgi:hypothetical protein